MSNNRYIVLDGLRGVAAIVVLIFHLIQQHVLGAFTYAALAVDFFYVLSGFVVALAYEDRIATRRMTIRDFAKVRVRRLYPLILLGTLAGIILAILSAVTKHSISLGQVMAAGALGLLLLPSFVFPQWSTAYPFNMASWSLTFEAFVNAVYVVIAPRLTTPRLVLLVGAGAAMLIAVAFANDGIAGGNNQAGWFYGFGRVIFPFFAGVLLYRLRIPARDNTPAALILLIGLGILLMNPLRYGAVASLIYVLAIFPAVVFIGSAVRTLSAIAPICSRAGALSYPIYILQGPILRVGEEILRHYHPGTVGLILFALIEAICVVTAAWVAMRFFDEPIQRLFAMGARAPLARPLPQ